VQRSAALRQCSVGAAERSAGYPPAVPQVVEFEIEGQPISVSARDADRLARRLRAAGSEGCVSAAEKIERATRLDEGTRVKLSIGEDRPSARDGPQASESPGARIASSLSRLAAGHKAFLS
jgi:hypothetical protein